jgi:hypothetical protein
MNIGKMLGLCCFAFNHVFFLTAKRSKNSPLEKPFLNASLHGKSLNLANSRGALEG